MKVVFKFPRNDEREYGIKISWQNFSEVFKITIGSNKGCIIYKVRQVGNKVSRDVVNDDIENRMKKDVTLGYFSINRQVMRCKVTIKK